MRLPGTVWTIDDYQVELRQDWSAVERANLGYDQFRGMITPRSAHSLPWTVGIGSVVRGMTDSGTIIWEGAISAPLEVESDDWVPVAAQGYAYEAAKVADRFPILVTAVEAWTVGNSSPLNMTQTASAQPTVTYTFNNNPPTASTFTNNIVQLDASLAEDVSLAFWARGANIRRFASYITAAGVNLRIYCATGPDLAGTLRHIGVFSPTNQNIGYADIDIPSDGYDAIVVRYVNSVATNTTWNLTVPVIWSDTTANALRAPHVAKAIGTHLGWDTAGVEDVGTAVFPSFDWAEPAIGALSQAVGPDDLLWMVKENNGNGPRLILRDWGEKEWNVSGSTGARWDLQRMERYNRVTAQYLDASGQLRTATVDADPDPLNGRGTKEALVTLGGLIPIDSTINTPDTLAQAVLDALSPQRYRGEIAAGRLFSDYGREATYEVRAGDTVRISDFSKLDGALVDRIVAVTKTADGVVVALEPTVVSGGGLSGRGGATPGTLLRPTNFPVYLPPGSPGGTTPKTTTFPDDVLDPNEWGVGGLNYGALGGGSFGGGPHGTP